MKWCLLALALLGLATRAGLPTLVFWALCAAGTIAALWGLARTSRFQDTRAPSPDPLPTREDLGRRVAAFRKMAVLPPLVLLVGGGVFLVGVTYLVRAGVEPPLRVGIPVVLAYMVIVGGAASAGEELLIARHHLECPTCRAPLAGGGGKHSPPYADHTLKKWTCWNCGQPVAETPPQPAH